MSSYADLLNRMSISVTSPDGNIRAEVKPHYNGLVLRFRPHSFDRYDETGLSGQLSRLGELSWDAYHKGRTLAYQAADDTDGELRPDQPHWNVRRRRYDDDHRELNVSAVSPNRRIRLRSKGLRQWKVDLKPQTINDLGPQRFETEFAAAFDNLMADHRFKLTLLKTRHFDMTIFPPSMRRKLAEIRAEHL